MLTVGLDRTSSDRGDDCQALLDSPRAGWRSKAWRPRVALWHRSGAEAGGRDEVAMSAELTRLAARRRRGRPQRGEAAPGETRAAQRGEIGAVEIRGADAAARAHAVLDEVLECAPDVGAPTS